MKNSLRGFGSFLSNPSLKTLGKIDPATIEARDREFMNNVLTLAKVDPDIIRRIIVMRTKINHKIKLTQAEASELLESLKCKGFYFNDLDISGYTFGSLNMNDAIVGGTFDASFVKIRGDNNQRHMEVGSVNDQISMEVGGDNNQTGMEVGDYNKQEDMKVDGVNNQNYMKVGRDNKQRRMKVSGYNDQIHMEVGGDNDQRDMEIGGVNNQEDMKVGRDNKQEDMKVDNQRRWEVEKIRV